MPVNLWHLFQAVILCGALIYAAADDLKTRTVNDGICILIALAGLISFSPASLFGAALCALPFYILSGIGKGGAGDVFLAAAVGFVLGAQRVFVGLFFFAAALLLTMFAMKIGKMPCTQKLPLVPFFAISFIPAYFI